MSDPQEAHREEIFEGLVDAAISGDVDSFLSFNSEWLRIDKPQAGRTSIRFHGPPRPYTATGHCGHCGGTWIESGIDFTGEEFSADMAQEIHLRAFCRQKARCRCWIDEADGECSERCVKCNHSEADCVCAGNPTLGPCLNPRVSVVWGVQG